MTDDLHRRAAFHVPRETPAWFALWDCLGRELVARGLGTGNDLVQRSSSGEVWEYLGSERTAQGVRHSFRHRHHPRSGVRESFDVQPLSDH